MWLICIISHKHQINIPPTHHPLTLFSPFFFLWWPRPNWRARRVPGRPRPSRGDARRHWPLDSWPAERNCLVEDIWVTYHMWPMNMILLYLKIIYYIHYQDVWYQAVYIYIYTHVHSCICIIGFIVLKQSWVFIIDRVW